MAASQSTLILLFSRSAEAEAKHKKALLPSSVRLRQQITQRLINHSQAIGRATGLPYLQIDEQAQFGESFGARFEHALKTCFALGYEQVITIGNDCPELTATQLVEAATGLENKQVVLGPASDGGCYLMGFRRKAFEQLDLQKLPWQQSGLCDQLLAQLTARQISFDLLSTQQDLDSEQDIWRYCERCYGRPLSRFFLSVLASALPQRQYSLPGYHSLCRAAMPLRAPPAVA